MLMDSSRISNVTTVFVIFSLLFAGFIGIRIWSVPSSSVLISSLQHFNTAKCPSSQLKNIKFPIDQLKLALEKAATPNKTLIIVIINKAYVEQEDYEKTMLDIFLDSFWHGEGTRPLINNLLIVGVDQVAYEMCMFKRLNCYKMVTDGVDFAGEAIYMSPEFVKMMWSRTLFLLDVLKHGYNFIFTDTDVLWLRNPFHRLNDVENEEDIQISTDKFLGNPRDEKNFINTGFYFMRSNNKTIALVEEWYKRKDISNGKKEQDVLLDLLREGYFRKLGIKTNFLDTLYFSGFCQDSKDLRVVVTVHANCCRSVKAKVRDLAVVLRDWKRFKGLSSSTVDNATMLTPTKMNFNWTRHFECWKSWDPQRRY